MCVYVSMVCTCVCVCVKNTKRYPKNFHGFLLFQTPFELMAVEMEDITSAQDGGVLKKVLKQGTGNIVPDKAIVRGE